MLKKRLERIIEVKERKKEDKERELKEVLDALKRTEEEIRRTRKDYEKNYKKLSEGPIEGGDFSALKEYLFYLEEKERSLNEKKMVLAGKANEIKDELLLLYKEIKKLEILKEKALSTERKEELKRLQKKLDEFALRSKDASI